MRGENFAELDTRREDLVPSWVSKVDLPMPESPIMRTGGGRGVASSKTVLESAGSLSILEIIPKSVEIEIDDSNAVMFSEFQQCGYNLKVMIIS